MDYLKKIRYDNVLKLKTDPLETPYVT